MAFLLGFFSSTGPIASFFLFIGKKIGIVALVLPLQYAVVGAFVVARFSFITLIVTLIIWIYNRFVILFEYIEVTALSTVFETPFLVLQSLGIVQAFIETFALFSYVLVSFLALFVSKLTYESLKLLSDEYYKIGMLTSNGIK